MINIKTQTNSTQFKENFNNANIFLGNFQVGLEVTGWANKGILEYPYITFTVDSIDYTFQLEKFKRVFPKIVTLMSKEK